MDEVKRRAARRYCREPDCLFDTPVNFRLYRRSSPRRPDRSRLQLIQFLDSLFHHTRKSLYFVWRIIARTECLTDLIGFKLIQQSSIPMCMLPPTMATDPAEMHPTHELLPIYK